MRTISHKTNEGSTDSNANDPEKNTTEKDAANTQIFTASLNVENASNETWFNSSNNLKDNPVSNDLKDKEVNTNVPNISTKQSAEISLARTNEKTKNNIVEEQPVVQKESFLQLETGKLNDYVTSQILQEPELDLSSSMNDSSAVDPLEFSGEFNDEFVNTNLLDNAELLKNFTPSSDNVFSKAMDKVEDSDIEILESEEKVAARKNIEDVVKKTEPAFSEAKAENKEQIASSDTNEIKYKPEEASVNATAQSDKPLTLDDIKDTGRTGHELYKCGYLECSFTASHVAPLKTHMKTCNLGQPNKNLFCPHCKKRFVKIGLLLEHMKTHGLKRFGCSMCKFRYPVSYQATAHMKTKHKFLNTKLVPADPTNPSVDGLFIVQAIVSFFLITRFNLKSYIVSFLKTVSCNFYICDL